MHPDIGLGFEVVGNSPMGGGVASTELVMVQPVPGEPEMVILSVEDMIADRMGQYASGTGREMLGQARELYALPVRFERAYLDRRFREESCGDYGVEDLEA